MRVLFLSQIVPYPPHGGVLQRGYHLLRQLGAPRQRRTCWRSCTRTCCRPRRRVDESRAALRQILRDGGVLSAVGEDVAGAPAARRSRRAPVLDQSVQRDRAPLVGLRAARRGGIAWSDAGSTSSTSTRSRSASSSTHRARRCLRSLTHHNIESMLMERRAQRRDTAAGATVPAPRERQARELRAHGVADASTSTSSCQPSMTQALRGSCPGRADRRRAERRGRRLLHAGSRSQRRRR